MLVHRGKDVSCRTFDVIDPRSKRRNFPRPRVGIIIRSVFSHFATHSMTIAGSPSSILTEERMPEKWLCENVSRRFFWRSLNSKSVGEYGRAGSSFELQRSSIEGPWKYSGNGLKAFNT